MNKQPLFVCILGFSLGVIFQDIFLLPKIWVISAVIFGLILWGLGHFKHLFFDKIKSVFLIIFFFSLGIFTHFVNSQTGEIPYFSENKSQNIIFELERKLHSNEKNKRYQVQILNLEKPFSAVIAIPKHQEELDFLHFYSAKSYLNIAEKPQYDFQFDHQKYLARQKIFVQGYIPNEISPIPKFHISLSKKIKHARWKILNRIEQSNLQSENKAILKGIILSDRTEIDKVTIKNFTDTGLVHILAISGSHMAIIFFLILFFLKPIFSVKHRNIPIYLSLFAIWAFAVLIDFGNSVVRSCVMISVYYMMIFLQRKPDLLHSMALAGLGILVWNTHEIFNIGFQLSFLAVFGIHWLYRPIINIFGEIKNPILRFLLNTFSLSLSVQLMVIPLIIYHFHQFPSLSIFINVVSIFVFQIFIIFSFIICILFGINFVIDEILEIYDLSASFFLEMVAFFARWDFSFQQNIPLNLVELGILLSISYFLRIILVRPQPKIFTKFSFLILLFILAKISSDFYWEQKDEILIHSFYQRTLISIKKRNSVIFIIGNDINVEKAKNFIINPYVSSRRCKDFEIKKVPKNTSLRINNTIYRVK